MNNIIVLYMFTPYDPKGVFFNFLKNYKKYESGIKHQLAICYKNFTNKEINFYRGKLKKKKIKHIEFIDPEITNDYDFGSYIRFAKLHTEYLIFFMNCHSYPIVQNWLKLIVKNYKKKTFIGTTGSYESISSNSKYRYQTDSYLKYFLTRLFYIIKFPLFPNPHIRTANFFISAKDFLSYPFEKNYKKKYHTWFTESGRKSMTVFFQKEKYNLLIVNSDGNAFSKKNWKFSETYCYKNQNKLIVSDKHTRNYLSLPNKFRVKKEKTVWG